MTPPADDKLKAAIDEAIAPLVADHRKYLVDVNAPLLPVSRADLHYVFDQYGTQLLDFSADMAPVGHRHPFVHDAIREHLDYYLRTARVGEHVLRWPVEYARDLVATFTEEDDEPDHKVLYTEGEREAVLTAIEAARSVTNRDFFAVVDTDIHDWVYLASKADAYLLPFEDFFLDEFVWDDKAALLLSLVTRDGRVLEPKWVQEVADRCAEHGVMLIVDESRTGFGRLGTMWGQHHADVDADLTVLGGPVGGGLALGAVVGRPAKFGALVPDVSPQAGSPVACAAGAGVLRAVNPGVVEHAKEAGGTMDDALNELVNQFPEYVVATYGTGLLRVIEFQSDPLAREFEIDVRRHGLLVSEPVGSSLVLTPPLIASEMEIKRGVDLMADTLLEWYERDAI